MVIIADQPASRNVVAGSEPQGPRTKAEFDGQQDKPKPLSVKPDGIPATLKNRRRWVCWDYVRRDGRWTKMPINAATGEAAKSNDPSTWGSFEKALDAYERQGYAGVGYMFDKNDYFVGMDFDHSRCPVTGRLRRAVKRFIKKANTYAEVSPSGTGVKLVGVGKLQPGMGNRRGVVEVYDRGRFFALTGHKVKVGHSQVRGCQGQVDRLQKWIGKKAAGAQLPGREGEAFQVWSTGLSDEDVVRRASAAKNGQHFRRLFDGGDVSGYDGDDSRADMALIRLIAFWTGPCPEQIERIFSRSALGRRSKWQDRADYRNLTITKVLTGMSKANFYTPPSLETVNDPSRLAGVCLGQLGSQGDGYAVRYWNDSWWVWDGKRFQPQADHEMEATVNGLVREEFLSHASEEEKRARSKHTEAEEKARAEGLAVPRLVLPQVPHVTKTLVTNVIGAMESMTLTHGTVELGSWVEADGAGVRRNLLSLENGLLDLDALLAGKPVVLLPHTTKWFSTAHVPFRYDPAADCPRWRKFLQLNLEGDGDRINLLMEWLGCGLVYGNQHEKFMVLTGEGGNGKSVFLAMQRALLGEENIAAVTMASFRPQTRFELIGTLGKLAAVSCDEGGTDEIDEGKFKAFVSGEPIAFDRKNKSVITARPTAKLTIAANAVPRFKDRSEGLWRRMIIIPFNFTVPAAERELGMRTPEWWIAQGEVPGVLNMAIEGLRRVIAKGFTVSSACQLVLEKHRGECNPARRFIQEHCRHAEGEHANSTTLFGAYKAWCLEHGHRHMSDGTFGKEMAREFPHIKQFSQASKDGRATKKFGPKGGQYPAYPDLAFSREGFETAEAA
jgi:P4 family phage/plasmid primase-like protien